MTRPLLIGFLLLVSQMVQGATPVPDWLRSLPDWARPIVLAASQEPAPAGDPDAWVVLDRTEVAYGGDNEIWTHRYRLVHVLSERGISEGIFRISGLGGKASRVKKLKGWNLRPDLELVKLDQDSVVSLEDAGNEDFSRSTLTAAILPRVVKGSWVAFESVQVARLPFGPIDGSSIMESLPIREWELETSLKNGWFANPKPVEIKLDLVHFDPYIPNARVQSGQSVKVANVPALPKGEGGHPHSSNMLPMVVVRFLDTKLTEAPTWGNWDTPAVWFANAYAAKIHPVGAAPKGSSNLVSLQALWAWMGRELSYKAVYLTPERGWIPEDASEVFRKRYGDCKDLSCFFLGEAQGLGFKGAPALARIGDGRVEVSSVPTNGFNHVIAALRIEKSLGLPAEVETPKGRFLLVDATDPLTPVGYLGDAHRGRQVLLCLPEGAQWVKVPDTAIQHRKIEVFLEIEGNAKGQLEGTLTFIETGDAWGLRASARRGGQTALREHILTHLLDLPPTGQLEVLSFGNPLVLERPMEVRTRVIHPKGLRFGEGEVALEPLGWRILPGPIQKPGVARVYPVEKNSMEEFIYRAKVRLPFHLFPVLPEQRAKTPFRDFSWKAEAIPEATGSLLVLNLDHQSLPAYFDYAHREQGVLEWKKDRNQVKNLLSDALAFKVRP